VNQPKYPWRPLGRLLVEEGLVGSAELEAALAEQERTGHRLGEILVAHGTITASDLIRVLAEQSGIDVTIAAPAAPRPAELDDGAPKRWRPLGTLLMERGILSEAQLADALHEQLTSDRRLGEILVERGYVTAQALVSAVIEQHGLEEETPTGAVVAAASSGEETYQVEDHGSDEARVVFRSGAFLDAVDFAFEYLEAESPERLRIFRILGRKREEVWSYGPETAAETEGEPHDLLEVYGYDVLRWRGPGG